MSENDTTTNGTMQFTPEQLAEMVELAAERRAQIAKAEAAKEARRRANARPVDANGEELKAPQAYLYVLADLLDALVAANPGTAEGMKDTLGKVTTNIRTIVNAASSQLSITSDPQRKALMPLFPPKNAVAPAPTPPARNASR